MIKGLTSDDWAISSKRGLTCGFMNMDAVNAEAAEAQASTVEKLREALYE